MGQAQSSRATTSLDKKTHPERVRGRKTDAEKTTKSSIEQLVVVADVPAADIPEVDVATAGEEEEEDDDSSFVEESDDEEGKFSCHDTCHECPQQIMSHSLTL